MRTMTRLAVSCLAAGVAGSAAFAAPLPIHFDQSGTVAVAIRAKESAYSFKDVTLLLYPPAPPYAPYLEALMWADGMPGQPVYRFPYQANDIIGFKVRLEPSGQWLYTDPELSRYSRLWPLNASTFRVDLNDGSGGGFGGDADTDDVDLLLEVHLTPIPEPRTSALLAAGLFAVLRRRHRE